MHLIDTTELYDVAITTCGNDTNLIEITGEIIVLNPFGHIPAEIYPFLDVHFT